MTALRKILLIEDEPVVSQVMTWCLEDWPGTEVDCAQNGAGAKTKLQVCQYGLAIIGGSLPGASGLELAEIAVKKDIPVLLTTGHPYLALKLDEIGFPYLSKPFALDGLMLKSQAAFAEAKENIVQVRASLHVLRSSKEVFKDALKQSKSNMEKICASDAENPCSATNDSNW